MSLGSLLDSDTLGDELLAVLRSLLLPEAGLDKASAELLLLADLGHGLGTSVVESSAGLEVGLSALTSGTLHVLIDLLLGLGDESDGLLLLGEGSSLLLSVGLDLGDLLPAGGNGGLALLSDSLEDGHHLADPLSALCLLLGLSVTLALLGVDVREELGVLSGLLGSLDPALTLDGEETTTVLEGAAGDKTLNLGSADVGLLGVLLVVALAGNNELTDIVVLSKVVELADLAGTLGADTTGDDVVGEAVDVLLALLDDGKVEDAEVTSDDAATDGASLALTVMSATTETDGVGLEEKTDTVVAEDTLLHGETVLVVPASDAEDVPGELLTEGGGVNLLGDSHVVEDAELLVIVDVDDLLTASCGTSDVKLHFLLEVVVV